MASNAPSIDPRSAALFGEQAAQWWDPRGSSRLLHQVNPVRLAYLREQVLAHWNLDPATRTPLAGKSALDVGCGGGLLTEPLARLGADATGLDASAQAIAAAREHAASTDLAVTYRTGSAEELAAAPARFDLITAMEVIEHVADRDSFTAALATLLAPRGLLLFSTPNRTPLSYAVMIVGAERITRAIPKGAHDWNRFLTPAELTSLFAAHGLTVTTTRGISYRPGRGFTLSPDHAVNYIGTAVHQDENG